MIWDFSHRRVSRSLPNRSWVEILVLIATRNCLMLLIRRRTSDTTAKIYHHMPINEPPICSDGHCLTSVQITGTMRRILLVAVTASSFPLFAEDGACMALYCQATAILIKEPSSLSWSAPCSSSAHARYNVQNPASLTTPSIRYKA